MNRLEGEDRERRCAWLPTLCFVLVAALVALSAAAQDEARAVDPDAQQQTATAEAAAPTEAEPEGELTPRQRRKAEKRRLKEERRAQREQARAEKRQAREEKQAKTAEAVAPTEAEPEAELTPRQLRKAEKHRLKEERQAQREQARAEKQQAREEEQAMTSLLPRRLARVHQGLRRDPMAADPTVHDYLDLVESGEASPQQIAAFGNLLGQSGRLPEALEYYAFALSMEREDPLLWLNVGTLHRQAGQIDAAAAAYGRALSLDPNNAYAHYNLGAVLDAMGRYEEAVEAFKIALTLDPSLGDPATNPQAANNERLLAVKLMLYREQIGSVGLPLAPVPGGEPRRPADSEEAPEAPPGS